MIKTQGFKRVLGEAENAGKLVQEPVACGEWWGNTGRFEYYEVGSNLRGLTITQYILRIGSQVKLWRYSGNKGVVA
ncbi:hypothetical protein [Microbulbifer sp. PAAF003]|uniref:hypothetical protein n=1 Tax=Microbulbifer sp. PAAF003 TaxID=3243375 RepID=UPI00403986C1